MYKKIKQKRRHIRVRNFFEFTLLPIIFSVLILLIIFAIAVGVFGVRFSSTPQMIIIIIIGIFVIGEIVFEISRAIIKRILKK